MLSRVFVIILMSGIWHTAHALDSDAEQPATLDADDMEMDFSTGVRVYRGNVLFRQGSIKMTCDELTTYFNSDGELDKAVCIGGPGSFKQRPEGEEHDVIGTAMTITMDQVEELVTLKSQAKVVQGDSTITGRIITYNLATEKANIKGGGTQSKGTGKSAESGESESSETMQEEENTRPSLVIQPRKKKEAVEEDQETSEGDEAVTGDSGNKKKRKKLFSAE